MDACGIEDSSADKLFWMMKWPLRAIMWPLPARAGDRNESTVFQHVDPCLILLSASVPSVSFKTI